MTKLKESGLRYFLSENKPILVITILGCLDKLSVDSLINCKTEISRYDDIKYFVFYCRDVEEITADAVNVLIQMQNEFRARGAALNFSALKPVIRERLLRLNAIRSDEISDNMQRALAAFSPDASQPQKNRLSG